MFRATVLAFALLGITSVARADSITIFNTGVDASGSPLPDGTVGDPHYTLVSEPGGTSVLRVRTSTGGYPIVPSVWVDDALSAWIGPNNDVSVQGPIGTFRTGLNVLGGRRRMSPIERRQVGSLG